MSLRQLNYLFISRLLHENTTKNYRRLGRVLHDARRSGDVDWDAIEDRGRIIGHDLFLGLADLTSSRLRPGRTS